MAIDLAELVLADEKIFQAALSRELEKRGEEKLTLRS